MGRRSDHTREELSRMALEAARQITEAEGLRGLRARRIVREMGYTIGTLYNLFADLDDLILHMNGETLDALHEACASASAGGVPEENLRSLAANYLRYTRTHPRLWNAIFEHKLPDGGRLPDWYLEKIARLQKLAEDALTPLFANGQEMQIHHHALVLWTSLFGMASVDSADRLPEGVTADTLVESLIDIYLGGLRHRGDAKAAADGPAAHGRADGASHAAGLSVKQAKLSE